MTEEEALLKAILNNPEENDPRLIYADWLDENVEIVPCPKCTPAWKKDGQGLGWLLAGDTGSYFHIPCTTCGGDAKKNGGILAEDDSNRGTGLAPDSRAARAEFIRVQCEIATVGAMDAERGKLTTLCRRERELLEAHEHEWRGSVLNATEPMGHWLAGRNQRQPLQFADPGGKMIYRVNCEFSRGFVSEVVCPLTTFIGSRCMWCGGGGELVNGGQRPLKCPTCLGTGYIESIAPALFRQHPVEQVLLSDRIHTGDSCWIGTDRDVNFDSPYEPKCLLPMGLFNELPPSRLVPYNNGGCRGYVDSTEATTALSIACVRFGRNRAEESA